MNIKTACLKHNDCFSNNGGFCRCLKDNNFNGRNCPFYKNRTELKTEQEYLKNKLVKAGRTDLIEKYSGRKINVYE